MTLEEAAKISSMLKQRANLIHDLNNIESCSSISGNINEGCNGLGFHWNAKPDRLRANPSREITYLIAGYKADIAAIDATFASLASPNFPDETTT